MKPYLIDLKKYEDHRGEFYESFKIDISHHLNFTIMQENTCKSKKNVIRGFHHQTGKYIQGKILTVLNGRIKDVLVDVRKGKTYGQVHEFEMSSSKPQLLVIPRGFAHGYCSYEDNTIVSYKTDAVYNKESEDGFHPLSKSLDIDWKIENPIISEKDMNLQEFNI